MWRKNELMVLLAGLLLFILLLALGDMSASGILGPIRLILGCLLATFSPGYALLAVLLPKPTQITWIERLSFSLALSIAVLPVMALILDRLPGGITLWSIALFLGGFTLLMILLALYRRSRLQPEEQQLTPEFNLRRWFQSQTGHQRVWFGALAGATGVGVLIFAIAFSLRDPEASLIEFYVLNSKGIADQYSNGSNGQVTVQLAIVNSGSDDQTFSVLAVVDGQPMIQTAPIVVGAGQRWEENAILPLPPAGASHLVEFDLLRPGDPSPYRALRLKLTPP